MTETDPYGKKPHELGAKLDEGKSPVLRGAIQYFPRAIKAVAMVSLFGANKYAWKGWESVPDAVNRYGDALVRHLTDEEIDGPIDPSTGLLHSAQVAWNSLARLEMKLRELEKQSDTEARPTLDEMAPVIHKEVPASNEYGTTYLMCGKKVEF